MGLQIDDKTMEGLVSKAIFDMMTPEKRDELIQGSIKSLMTKPAGSGFNQQTELERLFSSAATVVAHKIIKEKLETDPSFEAGVKEVFERAWKSAFTGKAGELLADKMADKLRQAITGDRY